MALINETGNEHLEMIQDKDGARNETSKAERHETDGKGSS